MTVNFSDWMLDLANPTVWIICGALGLIALLSAIAAFCINDDDHRHHWISRDMLRIVFLISLLAAVAIPVFSLNYVEKREPFTVVAQSRFRITDLHCHPTDCPHNRLPDDGTRATWLQDGESVSGRIYVDDSKVTLAPNNQEE